MTEVNLSVHLEMFTQLVNQSVAIGLKITEVANNMQRQVAQYVVKQGLANSYDTWHGIELYFYFML